MAKAWKGESRAEKVRDFLCGRAPAVYREQFIESKTETNLTRMFIMSIFLISVQLLLHVINGTLLAASKGEREMTNYVTLSLLTMAMGILFLALSISIYKKQIQSPLLLRMLPFLLMYSYVGLQLIFFALNVQENTGSNSLIIAMLIAGLFLVTSPLQTALTLGALFALQYVIVFYYRDVSDMWHAIGTTDAWANVLIITLLIIYISGIMFEVYLRNFVSHMRLQGTNRQLEKIAQTDSLTEILNRRGFFKTVDRAWEEYIAKNRVVAVCMFDIDRFKALNDRYGHLVGDACLRIVSRRLQAHFDEEDGGIICRYGGEEFLAIFRGESAEAVTDSVWRACRAIREVKIPGGEDQTLRVTISGGLAYNAGEDGCDELIRLADEALYSAKKSGRNRICVNARSRPQLP